MPKIVFQRLQFLVVAVEVKKAREGKIDLNLLLLYSRNTQFPEKTFFFDWLFRISMQATYSVRTEKEVVS